jgi:hypothetical protein
MTYQNDPNRRTRMADSGSWTTIGIIAAVAAVVLLGLLLFAPRDTTGVATRDPGQSTTPQNTSPPAKPAPPTQPK